jgi:hypothetical protein
VPSSRRHEPHRSPRRHPAVPRRGGLIAFRLFRRTVGDDGRRKGALALGFAGLLLHTWLIYDAIFSQPGLNLGLLQRPGADLLDGGHPAPDLQPDQAGGEPGDLLLPLAALTLFLEARYPSVGFMRQTAGWDIKIHVLLSMLAYSLLTLASVQAILLAVQDHHLRIRQPGGFVRGLPPLQTMESLLFEMIGAGFVLLTLALASGFAFLEDMFAQHLVHKTVLSTLGWLVFGGLLVGRLRYGWRGRTAIIWTLSGFVILILAYFGSKAVLELILQR